MLSVPMTAQRPQQATAAPASLSCRALTVGVAGRELVRDLQLSLLPGDFACVLGPNGVGKTLTLHTLAGLRAPVAGSIDLCGEPMAQRDRAWIARHLGLLLQQHTDAFPATVLETALLGHYARLGFWQWETGAASATARRALAVTDLAGLEHRLAGTLSGGERRRLAMATLLVQDPAVYLLDEPLNHLDPRHRLSLLDHLATLAGAGRTILASVHDPVLAARYARLVLLLYGDGRWQFGPTAEMLTPDNLAALYGTEFATFRAGSATALLPLRPRP